MFGNPGYLPDSLKRQKIDGKAPERELRLFKMKHYQRNKLYDFTREMVASTGSNYLTFTESQMDTQVEEESKRNNDGQQIEMYQLTPPSKDI